MNIKPPKKPIHQTSTQEDAAQPLNPKMSDSDKISNAFISGQSTWDFMMDNLDDDLSTLAPPVEHTDETKISQRKLSLEGRKIIPANSKSLHISQNQTSIRHNPTSTNRSQNPDKETAAFNSRDINNSVQTVDLGEIQSKLERKRLLAKTGKLFGFFLIAALFSGLGYIFGNAGTFLSHKSKNSDLQLQPQSYSDVNTAMPQHQVDITKPTPQEKMKPNLVSKKPISKMTTVPPQEKIATDYSEISTEPELRRNEIEQDIKKEVLTDVVKEPIRKPVRTPSTIETVYDYSSLSLQDLTDRNVYAFKHGQWKIVLNTSNEILRVQPNTTSALINRSVAHTELGMYDRAIQDCNQVINIEQNNPLAYNNRGYAFEMQGNKFSAINDYSKACELGIELSCKEVERLKKRN